MRCRRGFSLIEVLLALAVAAMVLGVCLNAVTRDMLGISRALPRYRATLQASQALEQRMEADGSKVGAGNAPVNFTDKSVGGGPKFDFTVKVAVVTADPRVEQVEVRVPYFHGNSLTVSAYRLRIRRQLSAKKAAAAAGAASSSGAPAAPSAAPAAPSAAPR